MWLRSPWCNTNKNLIRLFEKVNKHYPDFDSPKLTKEKLFKQILPNGKFSDRRMNNLLSEGYLTAERFIIFQNLKNDQKTQRDLLTKEFQNRHLEDWFFKDINKEIERLETNPTKDWEEHLQLLHLNRRIYHHPNQNPRMQSGSLTIVKMGKELDLVYLLEKAAIINEKIFRNRIIKDEHHIVSGELEKWRLICQGVNHPTIDFYKMRFDYTEENIVEQYFKLRKTFLERYEELNLKEQKMHLKSLLNDTLKLIKARLIDITETLPLYKLGLKTEILLQKGKLTQANFSAIVMASNAKKDYNFTLNFIEQYSKKLNEQIQEDAYHWANAHTYYRMENFTKSLDFLITYNFKNLHFLFLTKSLTTQVYFDLYLKDESYQSYLFNYFDSFEKWVYREKSTSENTKKGFLKFIQKTRSLAKYYSDINFDLDKVQNLLMGESNIQGTRWLGQKIEKVIKIKQGGHS